MWYPIADLLQLSPLFRYRQIDFTLNKGENYIFRYSYKHRHFGNQYPH